MGLLWQIGRTWLSCKLRHRDWKLTDVYKGLNMYRTYRESISVFGGKSLINIYLEINQFKEIKDL